MLDWYRSVGVDFCRALPLGFEPFFKRKIQAGKMYRYLFYFLISLFHMH